jgi:hypothetical protein
LIDAVLDVRRVRFDDDTEDRISFVCDGIDGSDWSELRRFLISSSPSSKTTSERFVTVSH